ncbi:Tigger transposable element-derived protein 6 [Dictyocoela muelleri]|nr:Tigger transposable element-derived protein 6 [Dictyocoela muelleri]
MLYEWFNIKRNKNHVITNDILSEKAFIIAKNFDFYDFKASSKWVLNFKEYYNIKYREISGEEGLVNLDELAVTWPNFKRTLDIFSKSDIFNCDETALFFKCPSKKTLILSKEKMASGIMGKDRVSILFCANFSGEKLKPLLIGKSKRPRGFNNIDIKALGIKYTSSKKAWMTSSIFHTWLCESNIKMRNENINILLLLENATVHGKNTSFSNITVLFLPTATTSKI